MYDVRLVTCAVPDKSDSELRKFKCKAVEVSNEQSLTGAGGEMKKRK